MNVKNIFRLIIFIGGFSISAVRADDAVGNFEKITATIAPLKEKFAKASEGKLDPAVSKEISDNFKILFQADLERLGLDESKPEDVKKDAEIQDKIAAAEEAISPALDKAGVQSFRPLLATLIDIHSTSRTFQLERLKSGKPAGEDLEIAQKIEAAVDLQKAAQSAITDHILDHPKELEAVKSIFTEFQKCSDEAGCPSFKIFVGDTLKEIQNYIDHPEELKERLKDHPGAPVDPAEFEKETATLTALQEKFSAKNKMDAEKSAMVEAKFEALVAAGAEFTASDLDENKPEDAAKIKALSDKIAAAMTEYNAAIDQAGAESVRTAIQKLMTYNADFRKNMLVVLKSKNPKDHSTPEAQAGIVAFNKMQDAENIIMASFSSFPKELNTVQAILNDLQACSAESGCSLYEDFLGQSTKLVRSYQLHPDQFEKGIGAIENKSTTQPSTKNEGGLKAPRGN